MLHSYRRSRNGGAVFRTEWRVTSRYRPPRTETYDIIFNPGQIVHRELSMKLEHASEQLKKSVLRFGEELVLSGVYFIGRG